METTFAEPLAPPPAPVPPHLSPQVNAVVNRMVEGRLVPFFGAGVNACGRPEKFSWTHGASDFFPTGSELARHLASTYEYGEEDADDLLQVSQYTSLVLGEYVLYEELRRIFDRDFPPTRVHRFFASLPRRLRDAGLSAPVDATGCGYLIITTNYDDLLERALQDAGERFHTLTYIADGDDQGLFWHRPPSGAPEVMREPERAQFDGSTIVLKIHGAVNRSNQEHDSFVITEEHYVDYLARVHLLSETLPRPISAKLQRAHVLFLGYRLRDWNVRAMLHHLWKERKGSVQSWAVLKDPRTVDIKMWAQRRVEVIEEDLAVYMNALEARLRLRLQPPPAPEQQRAA